MANSAGPGTRRQHPGVRTKMTELESDRQVPCFMRIPLSPHAVMVMERNYFGVLAAQALLESGREKFRKHSPSFKLACPSLSNFHLKNHMRKSTTLSQAPGK
jgi:hypothetical protein